MKAMSCLISVLLISLLCFSLSKAEYDKAKLEESLGQFLAIKDAVDFLSTTECGEYIDFEYKNYNIREEAKNYLNNQDYKEFIETLASEQYKIGRTGIVRKITNGIADKKSEGLSTEQVCTDLIKKVRHSYENVLDQWNRDKESFADNNTSFNLNEVKLQAEQENVEAQLLLARSYLTGKEVTQDLEEAAKWFRKAAEHGDNDAQYMLGIMYVGGNGVTQNYKEAESWLKKSASKGNADAQYSLGVMYEQGVGISTDYKKAVNWYEKAAEQGYIDAQYNLGLIYSKGLGINQDQKEAKKWFSEAAEKGDAKSQTLLGKIYAEGSKSVPQNYSEAIKWYKKAADQGDSDAQTLLGEMYLIGEAIPQDHKKAAILFRKSAQQGDVNSQYYLGLMYARGEGVVANGIMAYAYLSLAVDSGISGAIEDLNLVANHISENEIDQARKIAANIQKKILESKQ